MNERGQRSEREASSTETETPSKFWEKVEQLPTPQRVQQSIYVNVVKELCRMSKGVYRLKLDMIKQGLKMKSAYPSIDRALRLIAKEKGIPFETFKQQYMRMRVVGKDLFIEKLRDEPI